jgi:hypothetical protein
MNTFKVGDLVEVMDEGLAMLRRLCPDQPPNHHGRVERIDGDTIYVEFPIDGSYDEHSQTAPYPVDLVKKRTTAEGVGRVTHIKIKGDKNRYSVAGDHCIGCVCLQLGLYQHRGGTMSGSRNTGQYSACCMRRAYHGCPDESDRNYTKERAAGRRKEGMKNV